MSNDITPCIWLDDTAEQAADLYLSLFANSKRIDTVRYPDDPAALGPNASRAGQVLSAAVTYAVVGYQQHKWICCNVK